jgi:hypothetical protein
MPQLSYNMKSTMLGGFEGLMQKGSRSLIEKHRAYLRRSPTVSVVLNWPVSVDPLGSLKRMLVTGLLGSTPRYSPVTLAPMAAGPLEDSGQHKNPTSNLNVLLLCCVENPICIKAENLGSCPDPLRKRSFWVAGRGPGGIKVALPNIATHHENGMSKKRKYMREIKKSFCLLPMSYVGQQPRTASESPLS